jgi:VanZ family protein
METNPELKYKLFWLLIGYAFVALIVYLSLTSTPLEVDLGFANQDKLYHALAYFTLMFWFAQIYHKKLQRGLLIVVFVLLGLLMEYAQSFSPYRTADIFDMLANSTGVLLAVFTTHWRLRYILVGFEAILAS